MLIKKLPLQTILIAFFGIQVTLAAGIVGYFSFISGQTAVNDLGDRLSSETSKRIEQSLEAYLAIPPQIVKSNINAIKLNYLGGKDLKPWEQYLWEQIRAFPQAFFINIGTPSGEYRSGERLSSGKIVVNIAKNNIFTSYNTDAEGKLTTVSAIVKPYDIRTFPSFKEAVRLRKAIWSPVDVSILDPTLFIGNVNPVYDRNGNLQVLLGATVRLDFLGKFLRDLQIGKTGQAFIIERDGNLIATSTTELPFRSINGKRERLSVADSSDRPTRESMAYLKLKFNNLKQIQALERFRIEVANIPYVLTVLPYRDRQGLDWLIAVIMPESDFMGQIYDNTRMNLWLCGLILIVAIAIGILVSRLITQPVLKINRASQAIASGDFARRLKVQGIAELETLSDSFNSMAGQLESAFENLEHRVSERTSELAVANAQIVKLNANLSEENMRLSSELEVTSRLQRMILPRERELKKISQLQISGFMEPALEVGGDYYDVLSHNEFIKIGIGDVTGHGLESGVLMIMVQTAIRTLQEHGESDPIKFLSTINRVIYKNAERMDSLKNLTLMILDYHDRVLRLSGQHEEVIVVRAANGEIERFDTLDLGFPIGLEPEIIDFINHVQIPLNTGDVVVLYTDGITEAENPDQVQYGLGNLCRVLRANFAGSALQIREQIIRDLKIHIGTQKVFDDITLLVIKQN